MQICAPGIYEGFLKVATGNQWVDKANTYFDFYDGYGDGHGNAPKEKLFTTTARLGINGCHRAHFLDELIKLVPENVAHFGKRLEKYEEKADGKLLMHFKDGTTAEADALIGADGIKSKIRESMFGVGHPCVVPSFTGCVAYRGVVPMDLAVKAVGEEKAKNSSIFMGSGGHVLTMPIEKGKLLNIVAFHRTYEDWKDTVHLTRPATRADALQAFASFGEDVKNLLMLTNENLDVWAIFDLGDHPPPFYNKGRVCIHGDAAHATSPHHGSGAGFCIEGSAIMAELIAHPLVKTPADLEKVFSTYNAVRGERTKWLVQSSRDSSDVYDWQVKEFGKDFSRHEAAVGGGNSIINDIDVSKLIESATIWLESKLSF